MTSHLGGRHRAVVVGAAGKQGQEYVDLLPDGVELVGLVDVDPRVAGAAAKHGVPHLPDVASALDRVDFDLAIVTVPHHLHFDISRQLLAAGRHVIKEKPFALTTTEARELAYVAREQQVSVFTTVQRNYRPTIRLTQTMLPLIGTPYWFSYDYHTNVPRPTNGWRSRAGTAGGGVLLDMGYHVVDVIRSLFGSPDELTASISYCYAEMRERRLEDVAGLGMRYRDRDLAGSLQVSRHSYRKHERLEILGTEGALVVEPGSLTRYSRTGEPVERIVVRPDGRADAAAMLTDYVDRLGHLDSTREHVAVQVDNVATIERAYHLISAARVPLDARALGGRDVA